MTQLAIAIDLDRCVGCNSCTVSCIQEHDLPLDTFFNEVYRVGPNGKFPELELYFLPLMCQQCKDPACVKVCPTGASYKREDGIVLIDHEKCVGCQYCVFACPYGARTFLPKEGLVIKCDLCAKRIEAGKIPICVETCPAQARYFGDIDDPNSEISQVTRKAGNNAHVLRPSAGTKPSSSFILKNHKWRGLE